MCEASSCRYLGTLLVGARLSFDGESRRARTVARYSFGSAGHGELVEPSYPKMCLSHTHTLAQRDLPTNKYLLMQQGLPST
jgi:hypothetical protein